MKKLGPTRMGIDHNKQMKQKGRATFSQQKTVRDNSAGRTTWLNMAQNYLDSLKTRRLNWMVINAYLKKSHPEVFDVFRIHSKYSSDNAGKDKQRILQGARESSAEPFRAYCNGVSESRAYQYLNHLNSKNDDPDNDARVRMTSSVKRDLVKRVKMARDQRAYQSAKDVWRDTPGERKAKFAPVPLASIHRRGLGLLRSFFSQGALLFID